MTVQDLIRSGRKYSRFIKREFLSRTHEASDVLLTSANTTPTPDLSGGSRGT